MKRIFLPRLTMRDLEEIARCNAGLAAAGAVLQRSNLTAAAVILHEMASAQNLLCRLYNHAEQAAQRASGTIPAENGEDVAAASSLASGIPAAPSATQEEEE
jgi:hypothetical protein